MPVTRRQQRQNLRLNLQQLAIDIYLFSNKEFSPLVQLILEVSQLVATPRTREECPPSQIRATLPILCNFLLMIDQSINGLQRLCARVENILISLDSDDKGGFR